MFILAIILDTIYIHIKKQYTWVLYASHREVVTKGGRGDQINFEY